jgi:hypothetical protein
VSKVAEEPPQKLPTVGSIDFLFTDVSVMMSGDVTVGGKATEIDDPLAAVCH